MTEKIPDDIRNDLARASALHERTTADYNKCVEFNKLMSDLLARLEDARCFRMADRVMTILLSCNPRDGVHCDQTTLVGDKIKRLSAAMNE